MTSRRERAIVWVAGLMLAACLAVPVAQPEAHADGPTANGSGGDSPPQAEPPPTVASVPTDSPALAADDDEALPTPPPPPLGGGGEPIPAGVLSALWPEALPFTPSRALDGVVLRASADHPADLVVILSVDGLRPDAIHAGLPTYSRLRREGTWANDATTIRMSVTLASHASMVSGVDSDQHELAFNSFRPAFGPIRFPTIFRIARGSGLATAMFVGKNKLFHLVEDGGAERFVIGGRECTRVARRASTYLRTAPNGLVFVHFADADAAGHRRGWMSPLYRQAVTATDTCLAEVITALEARGHIDRTLLIVTSDHGGHGRSHGSDMREDMHIPWMAWGGAASHGTIARPITTLDTAATALAALGLPHAHGMRGVSVREALHDPNAPAPAQPTPRRRPRPTVTTAVPAPTP